MPGPITQFQLWVMAMDIGAVTRRPLATGSRTIALATLCGVLFLTFLDTTIVSVALGDIQSSLHAGVSDLQWVVNGYAVVFASLMLTFGAIGDRIGRRKVLIVGVVIFCVGSGLAATASDVTMLIAGRAVMGLGAAASEPGTLSVIRHLYAEPKARARAIGIWVATAGAALALGPVIGGLLIAIAGWSAIFWFNLALGVVLLAAVSRYVPDSSTVRDGTRLDLGGFVFGAAFLSCGAFAVIRGETAGYSSTSVVALFVISGLSLLALIGIERKVAAPMIDRRFLSRSVTSSLLVSFGMYFGIFSIFFFTALYLQEVSGYSGGHIAGVFAPMAITLIGASLLSGRWVARSGPRTPMALGCLLAAAGIAGTDWAITQVAGSSTLATALGLAGVGFGLGIVPATSAVLSGVPAEHSGIGASMVNTSRQVGAVIGVAVLGALVNSHLTGDLRARLTSLGVPDNFQSLVSNAIERGDVPAGGAPSASASYGSIVTKVIDAAYGAFRSGLQASLFISALVLVAAAGVALMTTGPNDSRITAR